ncbi:MAG: hypothetical protein DHS20C18_31600 [Saprospiraceae bacterium]|nr:MAG: hypothetical protein DHS20C18_31600 [Saprospiraceae bacterium]
MMAKKIILIILGISIMGQLSAQSWKKLSKAADGLIKEGKYEEAAATYEQAWQKKQSKKDLIYKAGEAYYTIRDYRKAAEAYQNVKDENNNYPLVGLKYARSLKQDGQYKKAIDAFNSFADKYTGDGKAILQDVVNTEIKGAELGQTLGSQADRSVEVLYPGVEINSDAAEFAPFLVGPEELYFSSSMGGKARVYSSRKIGNRWSKAATPGNFPVISQGQYANATMTPDGERMYFTICNNDKRWDDLNTRCEIFVIKKQGAAWSQPERLPDYINMKGVTATHPFTIHQGGQEILYYASNRDGGRGGMDIWFAARDLGEDDNDFTFPINLGATVNTLGDEITPFYSADEGTLYFSSNGHVSIGGFDVLKTRGEETNWGTIENVGLPINSSADDYFFVKNSSSSTGFLVSNRAFGGEKSNTTNSDIFELQMGGKRIALKGNAYDQESGGLLNNITVSLFQVFDDGSDNLLISKEFASGSYSFELLPNRSFRVEVGKPGFLSGTYNFVTNDPNTFTYGQPVFLEPSMGGGDEPLVMDPVDPGTKPRPNVNKPEPFPAEPGVTYTARGTSTKDNLEYVTSAPKHRGIYFKIQIAAVKRFNPNDSKYAAVQSLGRFDTEEIPSRGLTRVLVAEFFSQEDAESALQSVQSNGFSNAYLVKYEDGNRYGRVNLD